MANSLYRLLDRYHLLPTLVLFFLLLILAGILYYFTGHDVNWPGFFAMMGFYGLIFYLGSWAGKMRATETAGSLMLAGRTLPLGISVFTMAATWIDGGYILGSAEYTAAANQGLVWVQAPWGYALSLIFGGLVFAVPMRKYRFHTILDPLEQRFGKRVAAIQFLPALTGELFWSGAILTALGMTFAIVLDLDTQSAIIVSAAIAVAYTSLGGLWAVAVTDVAQLIILVVGLLFVLPDALGEMGGASAVWSAYQAERGASATLLPSREALGDYYWYWWDYALLLVCGGVAWQSYFQRVLSAKDTRTARRLSYLAGVICLFAAIPSILIGMGGSLTDWAAMGLPSPANDASILPHVIRYLTDPWVATIGLGAVAAGVLSSVDASILSASSMATWNVYRPLVKPKADSRELARVIKKCIWIIGVAATLLALRVKSIYVLWALCSDFVYCLLFPALVAALFDKKANTWGAMAGFFVAFVLRFGGGEPALGLPAFLPYPMMKEGVVLFPFRTFSMLSGMITIFVVSRLSGKWSPPKPLKVQELE